MAILGCGLFGNIGYIFEEMKLIILDWVLMPVAIIRIFTMTKESRKDSLDFMNNLKNSDTFTRGNTIPYKVLVYILNKTI